MAEYLDNSPFNMESPQSVYYQYSKDIVWNEEDPIPSFDDSRFEWESLFRPYIKRTDRYEMYHLWMRFKIGEKGIWSSPVRFIYGDIGVSGINGRDGRDGQDGQEGLRGYRGEKGDKGIKGDTGSIGPKGDKGDTGDAGVGIGGIGVPAGGLEGQSLMKVSATDYAVAWQTVTSGWLSGSGVPSDSLGKITDWYIDTTTSQYYEKTNYTVWELRGTFRGLQGVTGLQGPVGENGVAGIVYKGDWVTGTTYVENDVVRSISDGNAYFCKLGLTSNTDPGTLSYPDTNWVLFVMKGATGPQGPTGIEGPIGIQGPAGISWVPVGGTTGQVMVKMAADPPYGWSNLVPFYSTIDGALNIGVNQANLNYITGANAQALFKQIDIRLEQNALIEGTVVPQSGWSGTIRYNKIGKQVTIQFAIAASSFFTSGLCSVPVALRPLMTIGFIATLLETSGDDTTGQVITGSINSIGQVSLSPFLYRFPNIPFVGRLHFTITYLV